jgi:hypothetical protein
VPAGYQRVCTTGEETNNAFVYCSHSSLLQGNPTLPADWCSQIPSAPTTGNFGTNSIYSSVSR